MADIKYTDQGSAIDPDVIRYTNQGSAIDPDAVQYTDQGSAVDPDAVQYTEQGSAVDPDAGHVPAGSGTEGELVVIGDGTAVKRYNPGFRCNAKVLEKLKEMSGKGYVADILDYGTRDFGGRTCDFETMKYYPLGAVSKYDLRGNAEAILRIVAKTALCLDACHRKGIIHKDVKPANILVTDAETWDCVLCDFGFADLLENGRVSTLQNRTPIYASPEMYDPLNTAVISGRTYCTLTASSDFYSLGMTALSLWSGEAALYARESELAIQKRKDRITVDKEIPNPLNRIIRGLLVKDPSRRWGLDEIRRTIQKGENVAVYTGGFEAVFDGGRNMVASSLEELAELMLKDQKLAKRYLYTGQVSRWLEKYPEIRLEIDRIVEKDFPKDETMGMLCALHILNPLYDINLRTPDHPAYAMTGRTIGRVLNDAYNLYYGKFGGERKRVIEEWDDECTSKVRGPAVLLRLAASFASYSENSYLVWFFMHKGNRFAEQLKWMKYCLDFGSRDNRKKAGPKDAEYLEQTAMMKTVAGFGFQPSYDYPDEPAGLRGYLAVKHHENPHADLSVKFSYERLLEKYLEEYRRYCPDCIEGARFDQARLIAEDTAERAKNGTQPLVSRSIAQLAAAVLLAGGPALYLLISAIVLVAEYPEVDVSGINMGWPFAIAGIVLGIVAKYVVEADGLVFPAVTGLVSALLLYAAVRILGTYVCWIYLLIILALIAAFVIKVILPGTAVPVRRMETEPGFMELTLEPLYFAFNGEKTFTSSLSAYIDEREMALCEDRLRRRRKTVLIFIGAFWLLVAGQHFINKYTGTPSAAEDGIRITRKERGIIHDSLQ